MRPRRLVTALALLISLLIPLSPVRAAQAGSIAAGGQHSCLITGAGGLKCWGWNGFGQLGTGSTEFSAAPTNVVGLASGVEQVALGVHHTCALTDAGGVRCWGWNKHGELGDGTKADSTVPVKVLGLSKGVAAISLGDRHSCALLDTGGVKCWGGGREGELGYGGTYGRPVPIDVFGLSSGVESISAGAYHTCAILDTGGLKCWGYNEVGQIGNGKTKDQLTPAPVKGLKTGVTAVAGGGYHTCASLASGGVKCWGYNASGQLGDGTRELRTTPVAVVGLTTDVSALALGANHSCALSNAGGVLCWGENSEGQVGDGTARNTKRPKQVLGMDAGVDAITSGLWHTCALAGGDMSCWGQNIAGQVGMGEGRHGWIFDVPGMTGGVDSVSVGGYYHSCVLTTGGGVKCWGQNIYGEVGDGTTTTTGTPNRRHRIDQRRDRGGIRLAPRVCADRRGGREVLGLERRGPVGGWNTAGLHRPSSGDRDVQRHREHLVRQ